MTNPMLGNAIAPEHVNMRARQKHVTAMMLLSCWAQVLVAQSGPTQAELNAAYSNTRDWLYATHDYSGQRYVDLSKITVENAASLHPVCLYQLAELNTFQTNPIVYDGVMYVTTSRTTVALDAVTCRPRWKHTWEPKGRELWRNNRGIALKSGIVVRGTADGYLFALSADDGGMLWNRQVANPDVGETFTMPPLIYEDLVLIGPAGGEFAISGWVGAFRLENGDSVWTFKTVPAAGDPGSETWNNPDSVVVGGGAVWTPFTLDPEQGLLYVPVTNPAPDYAAALRPGANLYTNSLVVLDARTGALEWYEQLVPNDAHDWDLTQSGPLFTAEIAGKERRLVSTVGKDGMLRVLDRETHERVYEVPVSTRTNVDLPVTIEGVYVCPGSLGGVEWNGPAYNPGTNMLYVPAVDLCGTYRLARRIRHVPGRLYLGGSFRRDATTWRGWLTAVDASHGTVRWRYQSPAPLVAAVTTTAGGLVFTGELTGDFLALDASSGQVIYRFNTGGAIGGGIVTYAIAGRQYVAVMSGQPSRLFRTEHPGAATVIIFALP